MGNAEDGGLGEQRVLLVGGPQHGKYMNLANGQLEYEFTSAKMFLPKDSDGYDSWPANSTHLYKLDADLTQRAVGGAGANLNLFTHEVLWGSPAHGGFNVFAIREATRLSKQALDKFEQENTHHQSTKTELGDAHAELIDWQQKYDALLVINESQQKRLEAVRQTLEGVLTQAALAARTTGCEYKTVLQ